jgi:hypothetical protein
MRTCGFRRTVDREISRFPRKERLHMPGSLTTPSRPGARAVAHGYVAFHHLHGVGTRNRKLSRLNGWPMRPPVNASPRPSRATAHDSGPMWIATPSSQGTCTLYSPPVSRRFANVFRCSSMKSANMRQNAPQQSIASLRARNDESSPVGGADCKTWAHRYAPWRSLRRKSRNALSAGRIWRRLG